jgi:hypothetical protein
MNILLKFMVMFFLVVVIWFFTRSINPVLITSLALLTIIASMIWLIFSFFSKKDKSENRLKSWWEIIKAAFWGMG